MFISFEKHQLRQICLISIISINRIKEWNKQTVKENKYRHTRSNTKHIRFYNWVKIKYYLSILSLYMVYYVIFYLYKFCCQCPAWNPLDKCSRHCQVCWHIYRSNQNFWNCIHQCLKKRKKLVKFLDQNIIHFYQTNTKKKLARTHW